MTPSLGLAALRFALFLLIAAGLALIWTPVGSAEFVVLVLTMGFGAVLLLLAALLVRKGH